MNPFIRIVLVLSLFALPMCGEQLVEFDVGDEGEGGNANPGGTGGVAPGGRTAGGGTAGLSAGGKDEPGNAGTGGTGGEAGMTGGEAGMTGGNAGRSGNAGRGGNAGRSGGGSAGMAGDGGVGGEAGIGGSGGMAGYAGEAGILPRVTSTNPAHQATNVATNKTVVATFSETMNPLTIDFTLTGPGNTPVNGSVVYAGNAATFTPLGGTLAPNTLFTAEIARRAANLTGDALTDDHSWTFTTGTQAAQVLGQPPVPLGSASNFVILAAARITNVPTSTIVGDVGLSPDAGSNVIGFTLPATCPEVTGEVYVVDATGPSCATIDAVRLENAKIDAGLAFTNARAAVRGTPQAISGDLNGLTLYPGLYESGTSLEISPGGFLYLDAQGDSNAIFVIRSATTITTAATSQVILTKAAKAANVYWTAGSAVTLGTNSAMKGTLIAGTAISLLTGSNLEGRALVQGPDAAAITLDAATLTLPAP